MILAVLAAIVVLCYVALFAYFAWPDLRILARRLAIAVGFSIYTVMILCMAVVILLGVFGCASGPTYRWVPVDATQFDDKVWDLNRRLCIERGGGYLVVWRGNIGTWECNR